MTPPSVAVDAGQTEVRAVLVDGRGPVATGQGVDPAAGSATTLGPVATAPGVERINGSGADADAVAAALLAAIGRLVSPVGASATVAVGLSGFEAARADDLARVEALLTAELDAGRVVLASDGVTSLLGALGDRAGAVVAAGTGTIVVARGRAGWVRVDGWGSLLGDAGSGFAIGRAGLDAALRELDGRGGSAALLAAAAERFGVSLAGSSSAAETGSGSGRVADEGGAAIVAAVHGADVPTRAVAGFAEVVAGLVRHRPGTTLAAPAADALAGAAMLARDPDAVPPQPGLRWRAA